jgi:hypothetical protein
MVAVGIDCHCHDAVAVGNRQRRDQEHQVDAGLCKQGLLVIGPGVDEGLQEVNGRGTNDGRSELDLQYGGVDMGQPFGLVRMLLKIHARDEGLVTANDHHDQEIGNHDHIDQSRHYPRDGGFGQLGRLRRAVHRDGVEDMRQRAGIAHHGADQIGKVYPEMIDIHTLSEDQAEVQRQLQPAAHEDKAGKRADGFGDLFPGIPGHRHCDLGLYQIGASVPPAFYIATACAVCGLTPGIKARHCASDNVRNE